MKISAEIPQNAKNRLSYSSPGRGPEGLYSPLQRPLCINVYCSSVHNSKEMEPAYTSVNRWIMKMRRMCTMEFYVAINQNKL